MLTAKYLDARLNKPHEKEIVKAHRFGLYARIRKTGKISFIFRYKWEGKSERITLGSYPEISIAKAGELAKTNQELLAENKSPKREQKLARVRVNDELTVQQLVERWHDHHFENHPQKDIKHKYPYAVMSSFKEHVFPKLGDLPWDSVTRQAWSGFFLDQKRRAPSIASRLVTCTKQVASFGIGHGLVTTHPLMEFSAKNTLGIKKKKLSRVLSHEEIKLIFEALDYSGIQPKNKILFKLLLIYGCRTIELRLCQPDHLDFENGVWTVPVELTKTKKEEIKRPLFDGAAELFKDAIRLNPNSKWLFPVQRAHKKGAIVDDRPMGESSLLDVPGRLTQKIIEVNPKVQMEPWSKHDLRRTMRTNMGRLIPHMPHVAEKMLGHALDGERDTYDRYDYLPEKLMGYQKWYAVLDSIWNNRENVVVLGQKKA